MQDPKQIQNLLLKLPQAGRCRTLVFGVFCLASIFQTPKFIDSCLNALYGRASKRFRSPETQLAVDKTPDMTSMTVAQVEMTSNPMGGDAVSTWKEIIDEESGQSYFWNHSTGETRWERPQNWNPKDY